METNGSTSVRPGETGLGRKGLTAYAIAVGGVGLVFAFRWTVDSALGVRVPLVLFALPAFLAAWRGGLWPGLVAIVFGGALGTFFFLEPRYSFRLAGWTQGLLLVTYAAVTGAAVAGLEALHRSRGRLEREIARNRQTLAALEASEQVFRATFELAAVGKAQTDPATGRFLRVNRKFCELTGRTEAELVGRSFLDLVHPEDREPDRKLYEALVRGEIPSYHRQKRYLRSDGESVWVDVQAIVLRDANGQPCCTHAIIQDITRRRLAEQELRESEGRFRVLAETVPAFIFTARPDGVCDYVSQRFYDETGMPVTSEPGGSWLELLHPEDHAAVWESWQAAVRQSEPWTSRHRQRTGDGSYRWYMVKALPVRAQDGPVTKWVGAVTNIDPLVQAEAAMNQYAEQQKKLAHQLFATQEAERRRIARELHDQVGQSLSLVQLHLQALALRPDMASGAAELQSCFQTIEQVIEAIQRLSLDLRPTMLDDLGLIPALRWYTNQARSIGLNAVFTSHPKEMRLDPLLETACYRIVQEALTNVIRHARAKWVCVDLRQTQDEFHVTISDNGVGFKVDAVRGHHHGERALGLLGMEERAALVGGQIQFRSVPNHGTEVHVRFPLPANRGAIASPA